LHADDAAREVQGRTLQPWAPEKTSDAAHHLLENKVLLSLLPEEQGLFPFASGSHLGNPQLVLL